MTFWLGVGVGFTVAIAGVTVMAAVICASRADRNQPRPPDVRKPRPLLPRDRDKPTA